MFPRKTIRASVPLSIRKRLYNIRGLIPVRFRFGRVFWETYDFLNRSQWWDRGKLEEYQIKELSRLLKHAYQNVPYYRKIFDELGLKPGDIQSYADLRKLPCLTKDAFKQNFDKLIATNVNRDDLFADHTSGTTGKPLQFYEDDSTRQKELAFVRHHWARVGFRPGDALIGLRGAIIEAKKRFEYDRFSNILRLSPLIETKEVAHYYLQQINQFGASFMHGYPSAIGLFGIMIKRFGLPVPFKLKAILFTSEIVYPWERQIAEEVFNCRVLSHYGMAENAVAAGECEGTHHYHCVPQYGLTEIDPDTNEIIGTSFLNYVNPFIRYRTSDVGSQPVYSGCEKCGRQYFPILSVIEGRTEDFIITTSEIPISPAIITHPFKDFKMIKGTQLIQKSIDHIKLRILPWDGCEPEKLESELKELCRSLKGILGSDMIIESEIVDHIPILMSGKYKWIISEVSRDIMRKGLEKY